MLYTRLQSELSTAESDKLLKLILSSVLTNAWFQGNLNNNSSVLVNVKTDTQFLKINHVYSVLFSFALNALKMELNVMNAPLLQYLKMAFVSNVKMGIM